MSVLTFLDWKSAENAILQLKTPPTKQNTSKHTKERQQNQRKRLYYHKNKKICCGMQAAKQFTTHENLSHFRCCKFLLHFQNFVTNFTMQNENVARPHCNSWVRWNDIAIWFAMICDSSFVLYLMCRKSYCNHVRFFCDTFWL